MEINKITYENYENCYELKINDKYMVVSSEFGPRVIHFGFIGKENILFFDKEKKIKIGDWISYAGHRIWIAPESKFTLDNDNKKCKVEQNENFIKFTSLDELRNIEKSLVISEKNNNFLINHTLKNKSSGIYYGAPWAITCVVPDGTIFLPWKSLGDFKINKLVIWNEWVGQETDIHSKQYIKKDDLILINPTGEVGKIGTAGYDGYIGKLGNDFTFIKKFQRHNTNNYPDDNCAIECYTCDDFVELETLGPITSLEPGIEIEHEEEWILLNHKINIDNNNEILNFIKN